MNALNLRVSSVKTNENVRKNAEMRASLAKLPPNYEDSKEIYCLNFKQAKGVPEQVACVKMIFESMDKNKDILQFLCDLLFNCALKHPVRNQILKLLITASKMEDTNELMIVNSLKCSIQNMLNVLDSSRDCVDMNFTIVSISGCFENFACGLKSLGHLITDVFPFVCLSVNKYLKELNTISSPSVRNEFYLFIHNSIRLLLNCVQEYGETLKTTHLADLQELTKLCNNIVLDGDIPMDPRTNAGMLMAHIAKLCHEYKGFVDRAKNIDNPNEIALCVGVINTANQQEYQQYASAILEICEKIDEIANTYATVPNILLCATRALYQISKLTQIHGETSPKKEVQRILDKLMAFALAFMEHHMDSVRHLSRDLIRNVISTSLALKYDGLIGNAYRSCNSETLSLSVKSVVLQQMAHVLGSEHILENCPLLFSKMFADNLGKDFIVNNLYEVLMVHSHKEKSFEDWSNTWIMYLLDIAACQDSRLPDIETLIVKSVKCDARVVQRIIFSERRKEIPISTKLSTLWAVRKSGMQLENYNEIMEKFSKNLKLSILSNNDDTRIMALRLLVETHKTTEPLTEMECELLIIFLRFNSNCQCPATRQKSLALLTKALMRCSIGLQKEMKRNQKSQITIGQILEYRFVENIMRVLVENLFEGANFSRRMLSLQLLQQCLVLCVNSGLQLFSILPKNTVRVLYETLADSYESNNELAVNMLKLLEDNQNMEGRLLTNFQLEITIEQLQALLTSVRPTDSITGSYQLEYLCHKGAPSIFGEFDLPQYEPTIYSALKWLFMELQQGLKLAQHSILEAAKLNPLYGILVAILHMLSKLEFSKLAGQISWCNFITDLISLCKDLTNTVSPIVNSSSPEGHLPNDFGDFPEGLFKQESSNQDMETGPCKILSTKLNKEDLAHLKTTPQMVLLCAWRTVKEVSLILGHLVLYSPIQLNANNSKFLITKEQILEIGEHFKLLLSETKHRGAFEQAYVGFSKLCCRLWTVDSSELNALPMIWLRDLMDIISQEDGNNGKICATRRSAGVPFMVQALITSELKVGSTKALMFCMTHLFKLASSPESSPESRTHSLNILRALFRCSDLNEAVGEYVSEGVMVALRGYDATNWSEKNSATLLFAALITRIFGVQRTKDSENLNIRNRMTGRIFFLRYPKLYDLFLEELQKASKLIDDNEKSHKLHPLLLILSRLYASALEGTESNLKLSQFIPYISKCGGCPEMQTRYMAAKAITALINKDEVSNMIRTKCGEIVFMADHSDSLKLNLLHGYLLQIYYLVKNNKTILNENLIADISSSLVGLQSYTHLENAVIFKVILDIFSEILNSLSSLRLKPSIVQQLLYFSSLPALKDPRKSFHYYTVAHKSNFLYNLFIMRLTLPTEALADYMLDPPVTHMPLEQAETCLNIILLLLLSEKYKISQNLEMLEEYEILPPEMQFVQSLSNESRLELSSELKYNKALHHMLKDMLKNPVYYPEAAKKCYAILSLLKQFDFTLTHLLETAKKQSEEVKSALTLCVERVLQNEGVKYECAQLCLEYLVEIANPTQPFYLRIKAAKSMTHIAVHYPKSLETKRMHFLKLYIKLFLDLLMDDDYDIRDFASALVLSCLTQNVELYLGQSWKKEFLRISPEDRVVSTLAQRLFLQYTVELLKFYKLDDDFVLDIFRIIISDASTSSVTNNRQNESCNNLDIEIFDKSEANDFAEPLTIVKDAVEIFEQNFQMHSKVVEFLKTHKYKIY
ncbi:thyroid adenoma-associated protein homolog [Haematobia irritans]|uniref:thyroid adenoma-associated protein homolog n=1 Tax=Haematobia irritans TaxID=7368 RepID=UPI003F5043E3